MFKSLKLRTKFSLIIVIVLLVSLPIITAISYYVLRENAVREIYKQSELLLSMMQASRNYVEKYTTPIFEREVPGKFFVEGMADSFMNYELQQEIGKTHKNYSYKAAALNPLNLRNKADTFEARKIKAFNQGEIKDEWRGFVQRGSGEFYAIMKPITVNDRGCMSCHGDPDLAPDEVTKAYGKESGYNWKVGETVAVDAIYVPAEVPIANAYKASALFASIYVGFFVVLLLVLAWVISRSIVGPIERFSATAEQISKGRLDIEFTVDTEDEMKTLADAFTRMKVSIVKLMNMVQKK